METWNELTVKVKTEDTTRASDVCTVIADMGIYVEDYSDLENVVWNIAHVDLIEQELLERDRTHSLIHVYIKQDKAAVECSEFIAARLDSEGIEHEISIGIVTEQLCHLHTQFGDAFGILRVPLLPLLHPVHLTHH